MTAVIMVPCWNEAAQLPLLLPRLPRALPGLARVQVLVVDDGSTDGTADIAHRWGADHVCRLPQHQGLGAAFRQGLACAHALRAEVLINIDADGQYDPADIPALIAPIMQGVADLVLGARDFAQMHWNPPWVRHTQRLAAAGIRMLTGYRLPDVTTGFRALRLAAFEAFALTSNYSHTIETLIRVRRLRLAVQHVAVGVITPMRPSRLIRSRTVYGGQFFISVLRGYFT